MAYLAAATGGLFVAFGSVLFFKFWLFLHLPGSSIREPQQITIPQGMSANGIAQLLYQEGVISDQLGFRALCWVTHCGQKLRAGEYRISSLLTPSQIIEKLIQGKGIVHRVTFPEGCTVSDVARILAQSGLTSEEEILRLIKNKDYITSLGLQVSDLEGYLFPETYFFEKQSDEPAILRTMVHQFMRRFPDSWQERASEIGLTVHEVIILASLVEKEAKIDSERPLIAAVFHNRLKQNMPLQSDPTAVYDLPDFSGPITRTHLERESPYNTYRHSGLPIGPICNPGVKSLKAVLYPEDVPFLYFVSNNDGTHQFSTNLSDHRQAVERYREKREAQSNNVHQDSDAGQSQQEVR
jgi:UPF0755 protein